MSPLLTMGAPIAAYVPLVAIIALAAILRGFTGFGFALAAVPLMGFVIMPAEAVVICIGLQFLGGLADSVRMRRSSHWPSLRWLVVGAVIGSPLGTLGLIMIAPPKAQLLIAAICLSAVLLLAFGRGMTLSIRPLGATVVGLLAGLFNGIAAMPGPPVVAYYLASPLNSTVTRASLVTFFTATAAVGLVSVLVAGLLTARESLMIAIGLPVMLAGTFVGEALFERRGGHHRTASLVILATIAVISGLQGWSHL